MQVKEVMTRDVEVVDPETTIQDAAEKMRDRDVGPLPVCQGDHLVGMITDRDVTIRSTAEGYDPWTAHVRDAMTPAVDYCFEDQDVTEAARIMKEKEVRRLVVLDRNHRLVGIISLGDLAVRDGDEHLAAETLAGVSEPPASPQAPK